MKQQSIIKELMDDVQSAETTYIKAVSDVMRFYSTRKTKKHRDGMSGLFNSLIDYYGATDGKRKWACVIRNIRLTELKLVKSRANAVTKLRKARTTLAIAQKHL